MNKLNSALSMKMRIWRRLPNIYSAHACHVELIQSCKMCEFFVYSIHEWGKYLVCTWIGTLQDTMWKFCRKLCLSNQIKKICPKLLALYPIDLWCSPDPHCCAPSVPLRGLMRQDEFLCWCRWFTSGAMKASLLNWLGSDWGKWSWRAVNPEASKIKKKKEKKLDVSPSKTS